MSKIFKHVLNSFWQSRPQYKRWRSWYVSLPVLLLISRCGFTLGVLIKCTVAVQWVLIQINTCHKSDTSFYVSKYPRPNPKALLCNIKNVFPSYRIETKWNFAFEVILIILNVTFDCQNILFKHKCKIAGYSTSTDILINEAIIRTAWPQQQTS